MHTSISTTASQEYPDTQEDPDSAGHSGGASGLDPYRHRPTMVTGRTPPPTTASPAVQPVLAVLLTLPSLLTQSQESSPSGSTS